MTVSCGRLKNKEAETGHEGRRIVSIAKQVTELMYALGAENELVAADLTSNYPPEVKELPTVGYHRALSAEGILSMKPDLIIHDNNIGPEHVVDQLVDLGIPMMVFENKAEDLESTKALIREAGEFFEKEERAEELVKKLEADMAEALEAAEQFTDKPKVLVIHFGQAAMAYFAMTSSRGTAAQMIKWAGGEMAVQDESGMRQLSAEIVAASDPDIILLTDSGLNRLGSLDDIATLPGVAGTKAVTTNRVYTINQHDFIYFGPRTGENILKLQKILHQGGEN